MFSGLAGDRELKDSGAHPGSTASRFKHGKALPLGASVSPSLRSELGPGHKEIQVLMSAGGGGSSSETRRNPTEPPGPALDAPTQIASRVLPAGLQPLCLSPVSPRPLHGLFHPAGQSSSHTRDPGGSSQRSLLPNGADLTMPTF